MASSVSPKVKSIDSNTVNFEIQTAIFAEDFRGRQVTVEEVQSLHKKVERLYAEVQKDITGVSDDITKRTTLANEEQMFEQRLKINDLDTRISERYKAFNDVILTYYPTAKIAYGDQCIKPANSSKTQRAIRGDGNCFVSAFITRLLETAVERKEINKLVQFIEKDGIDTPELKNEIRNTLEPLQQSPANLEATLQNNDKILPMINYFRQVAANEMKKNRGKYEGNFLIALEDYKVNVTGKSYDTLVNEYVLKMGVDFSQPMMTALCEKLDFNVRIIIIDPKSGASQGINVHHEMEVKATFCRTGAHYYVLYPNEAPASSSVQVQSAPPVPKTKITVICNTGWGNKLFVRGNGPGMGDWKKQEAKELRNEGANIWSFEIEGNFKECDFKFLINNDENRWEILDGNHKAKCGTEEQITPKFLGLSNQ